ncbi:hypothetical protein VTK73DRAFT_2360 [Phialemonium thermophilum]|uniref:Uncharacterized protein n=1 Tax=Phialemonium thermophilum TaxID=223376 RepID=A0ABR3X4Z8_9PEZI
MRHAIGLVMAAASSACALAVGKAAPTGPCIPETDDCRAVMDNSACYNGAIGQGNEDQLVSCFGDDSMRKVRARTHHIDGQRPPDYHHHRFFFDGYSFVSCVSNYGTGITAYNSDVATYPNTNWGLLKFEPRRCSAVPCLYWGYQKRQKLF